ncbi:MAG: hypothetical protein IJT91_05605 [Clostridia bacterium]|nr:hypothetical protein [Clostridia bacterium]
MKKIIFTDMTLAGQTKSDGSVLSFREKVETVRLLDSLKVDRIELGTVGTKAADTLFVHTASSLIKNTTLSVTVGTDPAEMDRAEAALADSKNARVRISLPLSVVGMEYRCRLKPKKMLETIPGLVSTAVGKFGNVEFCAVDATRAEPEFLEKALKAAAENGAKTVTLCDTDGVMLPDEFGAFIKKYVDLLTPYGVSVAAEASNLLRLGNSCSISALSAGAVELKTAIVGNEYVHTKPMNALLIKRGRDFGYECSLNSTSIGRIAAQIGRIINGGSGDAASVDDYGGTETASKIDFKLSENDDISAIAKATALLGYDLSDEDVGSVYEEFKRVAAKKPVSARELDAIIASTAMQCPPTYKVVNYVINSGNIITASANLTIDCKGTPKQGIAAGDGPIDAAFIAIEQIIGHHYELDDFQIQSVTEGREAVGSAVVKLRSNGTLYSGRGISTDIIGASIRAYVNALNKIVYTENSEQ